MEYGEICVMTTTAASEAVAEILYEATGESVSITDRNDLLVGGWDYVEEGLLESYPDEAAVRGFFPPQNKERVEKETKKRLAGPRIPLPQPTSTTVFPFRFTF